MKVVVIGAGALGGQFAAHLARSGTDVTIVDTWPEHVAAIRSDGLRVSGAFGDHPVEVPAFTDVASATEGGSGLFDAAFVHVDANNTAAAGAAAREALKPAGFALQIQNGLGNVEALQEVLGADRVIGGSTMNSAALLGPGQPAITHHGPTSFGEWDGRVTPRLEAVAALFQRAGYDTLVDTDIQSKIWTKAVSPPPPPLASCLEASKCSSLGVFPQKPQQSCRRSSTPPSTPCAWPRASGWARWPARQR